MNPNVDRASDGPKADAADATRPQVRLAGLIGMTLLSIALCVYVAFPFFPALTWALALAVIAFPLHARLAKVVPNQNWAAGLSTAIVSAFLLIPALLVAGQLARETAAAGAKAEAMAQDGRLEAAVARLPHGPQALEWVRQNYDFEAEARGLVTRLGGIAALTQGSAWALVQILVALFVLFFAFRDWRHLLTALESLSPLSHSESNYLFTRVADSIHATVYATVMMGILQGVTGGLLFWALGLPAPLLWGTVMTVLTILPLVGAFLVWGPAVVALALDDQWGSAAILVTWGLLMAGPVGNWLYARLAGDRMRLHPVPVLIAFVGGLAVFGVSGMVLGPAVLAVTIGLVDIWRQLRSGPMNTQIERGNS